MAELARPLADASRLVVPDLRGHGRTGGSERDSYSVGLFADDVHALVTELDLGAPVVVGHSLGGFVALCYAARYTDACAGFVTLGAEVPEPLSLGERIEPYRPALVNALAPLLGRERVKDLLVRLDSLRFDERGKGDMAAIERVHDRHGDDVPAMDDAERAKVDAALERYHEEFIAYDEITVPSLHLVGEYEIPQVQRHGRYMSERLPDGEFREIPKAGHVSYVDRPAFVRQTLREFCAGVRG
ncbi:alpha/beta fold hydrolase [Halosegnis longus]|uniref:alpha/beta fold hydrolase n=1 Tax=Halosegnis longus TaxID=2216012 RepID=UPI0013564C4E|nr:alpha/beta hydrolase [Salella cibi]